MRTTSFLLSLAVATGAMLGGEHAANAQEIVLTGPLKGAPPVKKLRLYRENRLEIAYVQGFTLLNEFEQSFPFTARVSYYFTDWIGIGIWGGYAGNLDTDLTGKIDAYAPRVPFPGIPSTNVAPCVSSTGLQQGNTNGPGCPGNGHPTFSDQTAKMTYMVIPQITVVPFRGKLSLFQALFVDTEAYLFLGLGVTGFDQRTQCGDLKNNQKVCSDPSTFNTSGTTLFTVSGGLGLTFFINDYVNIGVEYRALVYPADGVNRGGFDSRGAGPGQNFPDSKVNGADATDHLNHVIGVSVGVMLGTRKTKE